MVLAVNGRSRTNPRASWTGVSPCFFATLMYSFVASFKNKKINTARVKQNKCRNFLTVSLGSSVPGYILEPKASCSAACIQGRDLAWNSRHCQSWHQDTFQWEHRWPVGSRQAAQRCSCLGGRLRQDQLWQKETQATEVFRLKENCQVPESEMNRSVLASHLFHLRSCISQVDYNRSRCSRSLEVLEALQPVQTALLHTRFRWIHRCIVPRTKTNSEWSNLWFMISQSCVYQQNNRIPIRYNMLHNNYRCYCNENKHDFKKCAKYKYKIVLKDE